MEYKALKCPNCGGMLDTEDGLDTFFCKYCGHKIILEGQSDASYWAKTKAKEFNYKKESQERKYRNEQSRWEREEISKELEHKREQKNGLMILIPMIVLLIVSLSLIFVPAIPSKAEKEHDQRVEELRELTQEIEDDISDGDYDHALLLTNRLRLNDNWSDEETQEWDDIRNGYINQIRRGQRNSGDYTFIEMPIDSDDCSDYTKSEMVELLSDAGFENIETEEVEGHPGLTGWFARRHTVEHVTIDGEDEFTIRDSFIEDASIVIYYYED